ncbi:glycosyltransferase [Sneathiella limimaris]|uniref:glycosyltransferase n=1 Tax=Sneathiella limimaris TaxID=1964213 RepID=UPI00146ACDD0
MAKKERSFVSNRKQLNIVNSVHMESRIFSDIARWFNRYRPDSWRVAESVNRMSLTDIYLFNRPHLERRLPRNSVVTVHHDFKDPLHWLDFERFRKRYEEAEAIVCLNKSQKGFLAEKGFKNCIIIPHGCADAFKRCGSKQTDSSKLTIGFISKRYERLIKGETYFAEILKSLSPEKFDFVFVGEGRLHEAKLAAQLGFSVRLWEMLPYRLLPHIYEMIDLLLITSTAEGGPASIPEAVASRTPVIGFEIGMIKDWIEEARNGHFLTGSLELDVSLLNTLAADGKTLLKGMEEELLLKAGLVPSWKTTIETYFELFENILSGKQNYNDIAPEKLMEM